MLAHELSLIFLNVREVKFHSSIHRSINNTSIEDIRVIISVLTNEFWRFLAHFLFHISGLANPSSHLLPVECVIALHHIIKKLNLILQKFAFWRKLEVSFTRKEKLVFKALVNVLDHHSGNFPVFILNVMADF